MALSPFITRNQLVLVKTQSGGGVDAAPDLTNAVLMEPPTMDPQVQTATTNELVGGFDTSPPFFTGAWRNFSATVHAKGSGTAGVAPDWDPLFQGCAMGVSTFGSDVTGTAQAGGTNTITLAAGASAVDNFYRGRVIDRTGGAGSGGETRIIYSYNGTTKVATVYPKWATCTTARPPAWSRTTPRPTPSARACSTSRSTRATRSSPSTATCRTASAATRRWTS
jgi:hypothetical protein